MKKLKVLVVDDIFTNRLLIQEIISEIGYEVDEASNGKDAIKMFEDKYYDLILMDIEMPVQNGIETTDMIRRNYPSPKCDIPIIALTAHNPSLFFEDYADVGFSQIITKPYSLAKLKKIIDSVYQKHGVS